jgi:RNA polymerase sigma factor (sigma-70 family)
MMSRPVQTFWPPLDIAYADEFGQIDPVVYEVARQLWRQAEQFALSTVGDAPAGLRLMLKAVALVSRVRSAQPNQIENLTAYLFQTYKRLILAELKKERGRQQHLAEREVEDFLLPETDAVEVERQILLEQLMQRMDSWTREVFELLVLGYSFAELGKKSGMSGERIRKKFDKRVERLIKQVKAETMTAETRMKNFR